MKREEIKALMLEKGFHFERATASYPGRRGEDDVYTRKPDYKYTFRVSRVNEESYDYGLYVGIGKQFEEVNEIVGHDIDVAEIWNDGNRRLPMWTGENLKRLLTHF